MAKHTGPYRLGDPTPVPITRLPPSGFRRNKKARSPKEYQPLDHPLEPEDPPTKPVKGSPTPHRDRADALQAFREQSRPEAKQDFAPKKRTVNSAVERESLLRMMFGDKSSE
ncbi:MAG: hypothetical protein NTY66_01130 [Candidatus Vogelbacteria bacterium]|nr:hypothetical protein [Candidatus Vogelbacteria bacterium]